MHCFICVGLWVDEGGSLQTSAKDTVSVGTASSLFGQSMFVGQLGSLCNSLGRASARMWPRPAAADRLQTVLNFAAVRTEQRLAVLDTCCNKVCNRYRCSLIAAANFIRRGLAAVLQICSSWLASSQQHTFCAKDFLRSQLTCALQPPASGRAVARPPAEAQALQSPSEGTALRASRYECLQAELSSRTGSSVTVCHSPAYAMRLQL